MENIQKKDLKSENGKEGRTQLGSSGSGMSMMPPAFQLQASQPPLQAKKVGGNAPVIQCYTDIEKAKQTKDEWNVGSDARVSDSGETVTTEYQHEAFATPAQIKWSNKILEAQNSGIEISEGSKKIKGSAPNGSGVKNLVEVSPNIRSSAKAKGSQDLYADCGRSSREVMGPHTKDQSPKGNYKDGSGKLEETKASGNPATFRDEILVKAGLGTTPDKARTAYLKMTDIEKDVFDKKHAINQYANPGIGDAFVSRRDDKSTKKGFNFHWGGVIMTPGHDKVTFENFAKPGTNYNTKDKDWYFETYGPASKKGQTWHERNEDSVGAKGKNNISMAASTTNLEGEVTGTANFMATPGGVKLGAGLTAGTKVKTLEKSKYWIKVEVLDGPQKGKTGWMYSGKFKSS